MSRFVNHIIYCLDHGLDKVTSITTDPYVYSFGTSIINKQQVPKYNNMYTIDGLFFQYNHYLVWWFFILQTKNKGPFLCKAKTNYMVRYNNGSSI